MGPVAPHEPHVEGNSLVGKSVSDMKIKVERLHFKCNMIFVQEVGFVRSAHPTLRPGLWVSHIVLLQLQICNEQVGVDCKENHCNICNSCNLRMVLRGQ